MLCVCVEIVESESDIISLYLIKYVTQYLLTLNPDQLLMWYLMDLPTVGEERSRGGDRSAGQTGNGVVEGQQEVGFRKLVCKGLVVCVEVETRVCRNLLVHGVSEVIRAFLTVVEARVQRTL